ncbi:PREDICTED: heavy metal-associated isoprenylated plant protein 20 [Tarenaya hassleriana]|uniref:heavy metal-associated isoprenylated plant protein 20 n=1 Tax=Tarenaya hassleriana TaxID=28532 RepID=UPI00053C4F1C|nr:PREDICTED: heavy metal-associated isoprenylated plant protein 20 [Tarenaya hassleriana]
MPGWRRGNFRLSNALSIVELLVDMDCKGCEKKVRRAISKLDGVDMVEIDMENQKVTVTGYVDRMKVLRTVRRTGRTAEFWPFPYNGEYTYPYASEYVDQQTAFNGYSPDSKPHSNILDEKTLYHLFSDDNVHACAIM